MTNGKVNAFVRCVNAPDTINNALIHEHFGEFIEEDYISKYNHLMRKTHQDNGTNIDNLIDPMVENYFIEENGIEVEPPPIPKCRSKLKLKGPYSSLSINMYGLTEATKSAKVVIDKYSINSVLLENDPQVSKMLCYNWQSIIIICYFICRFREKISGHSSEVLGRCNRLLYRFKQKQYQFAIHHSNAKYSWLWPVDGTYLLPNDASEMQQGENTLHGHTNWLGIR